MDEYKKEHINIKKWYSTVRDKQVGYFMKDLTVWTRVLYGNPLLEKNLQTKM